MVAFEPTINQVGEHQVILRATDASGSISLQSFTIEVAAPNTAPVITSTPPAEGFVDATFVYQIAAQDADLDPLTFVLVNNPAGASIDGSGRVEFSPAATGSFDFDVLVTDSAGNEASQSFTISVSANAPDALPLTFTQARTEIGLGQDYLSQITGTDSLGRPVTFALASGPASFAVSADGLLSFVPTEIGTQIVELTATTADGESETVSLDLNVVGFPVITTPTIVSEALASAVIGDEYIYDVVVEDASGALLSFELLEAPAGASIDPNTGTLRFTPQSDQGGTAAFAIEVVNADGQSATQEFTVDVGRVGGPPRIVSVPPTEGSVGDTFLYTVDAIDAEGDPLTFSLLDAPAGLAIVESTGEITFTPTADQIGLQNVIIQVADGFGGASTQSFEINISDGVANEAPEITSEAPRFTAVGSDYTYQIDATDPEGTALTFEVGQGPAGLAVSDTGLVTFTPAADQTGQFVVTLRVTDAGGATAVESFLLDVLAENRDPVIVSTPPTELVQGVDFRYDILVNDADFDPLTFELINAPAGTTINGFGQVVLEGTGCLLYTSPSPRDRG